jgi:2-desacetyl-2-hydroxyethyl bacteriochlorophyllide A dehydrogenase
MRAAVFEGQGQLSVLDRPAPGLTREDDVLIKIAANGLCGSDLRALATPPEMIYDEGVVIGHEFTGTVIDKGDDVKRLHPGDSVVVHPNIWCQTCWYCRSGHINLCDHFVHIGSMRDGGAAELCVVPERLVYRVPDDMPAPLAALAEPLACVLNGTRQAAVHPGESVLVLGAGPIGLLYLMLFKAAGASPVVVSEPSSHRAQWAAELGADEVVDPREIDIATAVRDLTDGRGADVAVDSVGSLLVDAVRSVRKAGRALVFGLNEQVKATLPPAMLTYGEIAVSGVYIARGTFPLAVSLLTENKLGFDRLVTHSLQLERVDEAIELLRTGEAVKAVLVP